MRFSVQLDSEGFCDLVDHPVAGPWLSKHKNQQIEIDLRNAAAIRSDRQNRYWWGCVVRTVRDTWDRTGEARLKTTKSGVALPLPDGVVHDALVSAFGPGWLDTPLGKGRHSSASLTVAEFTQMIERVKEYLMDRYQIPLPSPEEWQE